MLLLTTTLALAPPAEAASLYHFDLGVGDDWATVQFASPVNCIQPTWHFNTTAVTDTWAIAFWLKSPNEWTTGAFWFEGSANRVVVESSATGTVWVGNSPGSHGFDGRATFPQICTVLQNGWTHMAQVVPGATDARLQLRSSSTISAASTDNGTGAFLQSARDFTGTFAEVEHFPTGATAVLEKSTTLTLDDGLLALVTTTNTGFLNATSDSGFRASTFCPTGNIHTKVTCASTGTNRAFAHLGDGSATRAPAGDYTFTFHSGADASEANHLLLVGASVNW